jgi:hypothetical protein
LAPGDIALDMHKRVGQAGKIVNGNLTIVAKGLDRYRCDSLEVVKDRFGCLGH